MGAAASDVRKNLNLFVDGRGFAGNIEEFNPPTLTAKTEEFRGGGMNAPVKLRMGMEAMDTDFSLKQYSKDVLALFGLAAGGAVALTAREALESADGTVTPVVHAMRGTIVEVDQGTVKPGEPTPLKFSLNLSYYKLQHGSTVVQEIDVVNMVHIVNGVDQLAAQRAALGI
jgi:P2 family phage contractile tail tube protein